MYKRKRSWYSDFWYKGERYKRSHGPVNKTVAKERDRKFRTEVASGDYVRSENDPTFDKAMAAHLKRCKTVNQESTYRAYELNSRSLLNHFGKKRISAIEKDESLMRKYLDKRKDEIKAYQIKQGREPSEVTYTYINRELALLRAMFNGLIKVGKARRNPVSYITLFEENPKERILTSEEIKEILKTIDSMDRRYHHLRDIMMVALNTAMRKGEILKMKKTWVNLKTGIITVPRHAQKRKKKDKRVPINFVIRPVLQTRLRANPESEFVFVNPKTGKPYLKIHKSWSKVVEKAGIQGRPGVDKLRFHDLRHTAATNLARAGKDIKFIAQYLGHTDVKTSARYIHYSDEDLKDGADVLAQVTPDFTPAKIKSA